MPLRNLIWLFFAAVVSLLCHGEASRNRYAGILSESIDKISRYYVKPVDDRKLFESGLKGMLDELDPNSSYIGPDEYGGFQEDIQQQFGGIGIEVGPDEDLLKVLHPIVNTPAHEAGLKAGDIIISIDGQSIRGMSIDEAVQIMRGPEGSVVHLEVLRDGEAEPRHFQIERARIPIESVRGDTRDRRGRWQFVLERQPDMGYIRVQSFGDRTAEELRRAYDRIRADIKGLIIDLRQNPGGLLTAAVETCDLFIGPGQVVVSTRGRGPMLDREFKSQDPPFVDPGLPVAILIDRYSASASEIVAACLQDYERAAIVGERSYGKGTVQNVIEIEGGKSAFRLTTQTYWRPSGKNIHQYKDSSEDDSWGVRPDPDYAVPYRDDEEIEQLFRARRRRDYSALVDSDNQVNDPNGEPTDTSTDGDATGDSAATDEAAGDDGDDGDDVTDRQLIRAIQAIQDQLDRSVQGARAA